MDFRKLTVTFLGSGLSPVAPGTVGSIAASLVLFGLIQLQPTYWIWQTILSAGLILSCAGTIGFGKWAVDHFGRKDPQPVVLDEVAGICLTNLLLPWVHPWWAIGASLAAFRLFDVTKPPPCHRLEKLPFGWGILCDDLCAAVYANLLCQILLRIHF